MTYKAIEFKKTIEGFTLATNKGSICFNEKGSSVKVEGDFSFSEIADINAVVQSISIDPCRLVSNDAKEYFDKLGYPVPQSLIDCVSRCIVSESEKHYATNYPVKGELN